ncbi:hypothetical protein Cgig2_002069 [Carnegiea gigantea]|uniref:Uncharacterized protein n=1 Tax=Carnegiea gigantea TaxID=171969 RepID=A0A9Q1JFP2_9CARY|nr:hypothetical protein Cgig2_002069 [Carnegiea gigantea]
MQESKTKSKTTSTIDRRVQIIIEGWQARKGDYDMTKQKIKTRKGYTSGNPSLSLLPLSAAPWPSLSGVPASSSRGFISSSSRSSLSTKGERNIKGGERRIRKKRREEEGTLHTSIVATSSSNPRGPGPRTWSSPRPTYIWLLDQLPESSSGVPECQLRLLLWPEKRPTEPLAYRLPPGSLGSDHPPTGPRTVEERTTLCSRHS